MPDMRTKVAGYPIDLQADQDGRLVATSTDFPELATDGVYMQEALANAADALDAVICDRRRRGEAVPRPAGAKP